MTERQVEFTELSTAQRQALRHVEERTRLRQAEAGDRLTTILRDAQCLDGMFEEGMQSIRTHARVALHFHPDRFGLKPMTVAESLLEDGHYRNQFETGLSSGSRTAFPGGERDRWEKDLFGGAYHGTDVTADGTAKVWGPGADSSSRWSYATFRFVLLRPACFRLPAYLIYFFRE